MSEQDADEAVKQARRFADSVFADALNNSAREYQQGLSEVRADLGRRGLSQSSVMMRKTARLHGELIDKIVMARLNGLLEGYDLHGVPLDDHLATQTIDEVMNLKDAKLRDVGRSIPMIGIPSAQGNLQQLVQGECRVTRATVTVQIERRRRAKPKEATVMNVYHLSGAGSRVNVNSVDKSTNVTITESQLFAKMREEITAKVPAGEGRDTLLQKLSALEKESQSPSAWERYKELIAVAADHLTIICPFIPALTEMLGKVIR